MPLHYRPLRLPQPAGRPIEDNMIKSLTSLNFLRVIAALAVLAAVTSTGCDNGTGVGSDDRGS